MKKLLMALVVGVLALPALAKLPAPNDEAKAKAAEAAAKAAHGNKVEAFKTCKAMDSAAAHYFKSAAAAKKTVKPAVPTPACADPGPYVAAAPATPAVAGAPAAPAAATPAPAAKDPAKKS
jgi:hypothetical protein